MNLVFKMLPQRLPEPLRHEILRELTAATAAAFGCPPPSLTHMSSNAALYAYAMFSLQHASQALQVGADLPALQHRLFSCAHLLGARLRKWFGIRIMEEVMALGQLLYRAIGIEMEGDRQGCIVVKRCYFSQFYPAPVCQLISALDDGIFSGLSDGGRLVFMERLTSGSPRCQAWLHWPPLSACQEVSIPLEPEGA